MVEIAMELERSMLRPLLWQEIEGTVAFSRFSIHYNKVARGNVNNGVM